MTCPARAVTPLTVVLDAEGLSAWLDGARLTQARVQALFAGGADFVACANTVVELAGHPASARRLEWILSQVRVEAVTLEVAREAADLLRKAGLSGHAHVVDATVAAVARRQTAPVLLLTSDPDDMRRLLDRTVAIVRI